MPNLQGTWQYGRNSWCNGQNVRPWLADVPVHLQPVGLCENVVEYEGLFKGRTPGPKGYILNFSLALTLQDDVQPFVEDMDMDSSAEKAVQNVRNPK